MRLLRFGVSSLLFCLPAFGAFTVTTQWDVRTTGSDSNGGGFDTTLGGTNYAIQDTPQIAYTDMVIGGTTTQFTSVTHPCAIALVGNVINVTAGTGFTVQRVQVTSCTSVTYNVDKSLGTAASTGGIGVLGGGLLTVSQANTLTASGNTVNIKSGTYTQTSTITFLVATATWIGYGSTWADNGTRPVITTATNSTNLLSTGALNGGVTTLKNLYLSNTATTRAYGIAEPSGHGSTQTWASINSVWDGFTVGMESDNLTVDDVGYIVAIASEFKNNTASAIATSSNTAYTHVTGSYFHGNANHINGSNGQGIMILNRNIFANSTGDSLNMNPNSPLFVSSNTFAGNVGRALFINKSSGVVSVQNNIFYGNGTAIYSGINPSTLQNDRISGWNAYGNNTNANTSWPSNTGDVTLTASPFTNSAGGDYSLNSTSGGGAAAKQAGYPGVFAGGTSTGYLDIGAVQSRGSSTVVVAAPIVIQ